MKSNRSDGQKLVPVPMSQTFIDMIDAAVTEAGYDDRSKFIRAAIDEKIRRTGLVSPGRASLAPSRKGKGGRPRVSGASSDSLSSGLPSDLKERVQRAMRRRK